MTEHSITIDTDSNGDKLETPAIISIAEVADIVYSFGQDLKRWDLEPEDNEDVFWGDIRLQVFDDGDWTYHTGDSQYDQDHRGMWGYASVPAGVSRKQARAIAIELIEDVG